MAETRAGNEASLPDRYARGWHTFGRAEDFRDGRPHVLEAFGTKLVAYQGADGELHVLDGYCPHMGAALGMGEIEGDCVVCPFHGWKWGADGRCREIPYAKRIPPRARIKAWPTMERNGLLFVWHDHEGHDPLPEHHIPVIEAVDSDEWSDWLIDEKVIHTNCRELVDNQADMAHFGTVHKMDVSYYCNIFEGYKVTQIMEGTHHEETYGLDVPTRSVASYYGPAYHITEMVAQWGDLRMESILLNSHTPIDQNSFVLRFGIMVKWLPELSDTENRELVEEYARNTRDGFYDDVEIWDHKTRVDRPVLCDGDGPIARLRRWYEQFYTDLDRVPESLGERWVFESGEPRGDAA